MNVRRTVLGAGLAVAALAAPASAAPPASVVNQNLVYTVTASGQGVQAGCVFRADRWTADYGPTYIDGFAAAALPGSDTTVTCSIYYNTTTLADSVTATGVSVALIQNYVGDTVGVRGVRVCVDASFQGTIDVSGRASNCQSY